MAGNMKHQAVAVEGRGTASSDTAHRKIIHVDMDAFYASVEQRDNPDLRGKPVAVGYGAARGVVAAASYEARAFGIHSAMPSVTAIRKCDSLIFVPPRFEVYRAVSAQIREIFAEHTALIEPLSLDEAYLDVTKNIQNIPVATDIANTIRRKVKAVTGLNCSAGISYNKFLAKMASGHNKPNGYFVIRPADGAAFVQKLKIEKFHGVGPATATKMHAMGIFTGADLAALSYEEAVIRFGRSAQYYYDLARGIDHRLVKPDRERKSIGAENTFLTDLLTFDEARDAIAPIVDKVWRHCDARGIRGRTITLKVKFADFEQITRSRSMDYATNDRAEIEAVILSLLGALFPTTKGIRLLGVTMASLADEGRHQEQIEQLSLAI